MLVLDFELEQEIWVEILISNLLPDCQCNLLNPIANFDDILKRKSSKSECKCSWNFLNPNCKLHRYDWIDAYVSNAFVQILLNDDCWISLFYLPYIVFTLKIQFLMTNKKLNVCPTKLKISFPNWKSKIITYSVYYSCQKACFHICVEKYISISVWESLFPCRVGKRVFILL